MTDSPTSAYDLLTKKTLELTDAEVEVVIKELRQKRVAYNLGTADKDGSTALRKKPATASTSAADKAANTAALMAKLKLPGM